MNNEGLIVRAKPKNRYTVLPNAFLQSEGLSWRAKGLLSYLLSLPDDWTIQMSHLEKICKVKGNGRATIRETFKELQSSGYILSQRIKKGNLYSGWRHVVYDESQNPESNEIVEGTTCVGTEPRRYENQQLQITNDLQITNEDKFQPPLEVWPTFDDFWSKYDKHVDLDKAKKKWHKLKQEEREEIMLHLEDYIPATTDKSFRRNPTTYLNNKTWKNEIITEQKAKSITANATSERLKGYND